MLHRSTHYRIHIILSALIAFLLPFKKGVPVLIILLCLNWILEGNFRNKFQEIKKRNIFILFISLYALYVAGLGWSSNLGAGLFDLQVKLSLLVFPIIYSTTPLDKKDLNNVLSLFLAGCCLASILLLIRATYLYFLNHVNDFLYVNLSCFMHPSYFAMYLNFAVVYLIILSKDSVKYLYKYRLLLIVFFCVILLLLCSKIGYVSLFFGIIIWSGHSIIKHKRIMAGIITIVLLGVSIILGVTYSDLIYGRLKGTMDTLSGKNEGKANTESTAVRINIWKAATELSYIHPVLGYGTGSANEHLINKYKEEGIARALELKLNAHNAFFQVLVSLGYAGLVLFLAALLIPAFIAGKENNWLYVFFILLFILSCIPESILEAQAGTMYFGFFNSLLFFRRNNN